MDAKRKLHVIFLGAGASATSGYPIGEKLRLRLCSPAHFKNDLSAALGPMDNDRTRTIVQTYLDYFVHFKEITDLLRHGGFATIDEFSKLASVRYPEIAQKMKRLMRLAFSFHNPETNFHSSDYYPFLQRLFKEDLFSLREDTIVLSYNYDCYLDFLLTRAVDFRQKLCPDANSGIDQKNALTSGFFLPSSTQWTRLNGFKHMKLHGSIAYANDAEFSHKRLFSDEITTRMSSAFGDYDKKPLPPIVFPWEVFDQSGNFILESDFIFERQASTAQEKIDAKILFGLYEAIWQSARSHVKRANKISFVGLSLHEYMKQGLAYLFRGKENETEIVIANSGNLNDVSIRLGDILQSCAPDMHARGNWIVPGTNVLDSFGKIKRLNYGLTQRGSFADFIEKEMN